MLESSNSPEPFGPVIHTYTRAEAIADGVLLDVSETAREAGIRYPVALTSAAWARCVEIPTGVQCQDEAGRLWDVLWMLRYAITRASGGNVIMYSLYVRQHNRKRLTRRDLVQLKAVCGPGDQGEPVITVMLPEEDYR